MTTKAEILRAIGKHCLECVGGSFEARKDCGGDRTLGGKECNLYPFRFGKDPKPARRSKTNLPKRKKK